MIVLDKQAEALIGGAAQVRAQITEREVQLKVLRTSATEQNPDVMRLNSELRALRAELARMESTQAGGNASAVEMPVGRIPAAAIDYVRARRELKLQETLLEGMVRQYEIAKLDEAKEGPILQQVDVALPPDRKSKPSRALIVIVATVLALLASTRVRRAAALQGVRARARSRQRRGVGAPVAGLAAAALGRRVDAERSTAAACAVTADEPTRVSRSDRVGSRPADRDDRAASQRRDDRRRSRADRKRRRVGARMPTPAAERERVAAPSHRRRPLSQAQPRHRAAPAGRRATRTPTSAQPLAGRLDDGCTSPHSINVGTAPSARRRPSGRTLICQRSTPCGVARSAGTTSPGSKPAARNAADRGVDVGADARPSGSGADRPRAPAAAPARRGRTSAGARAPTPSGSIAMISR